ncbi:MAG: phytanoyl-CoA dioxygenase family protein [Chitinophagales bacterium]
MFKAIRKFKPAYTIYNILHKDQLAQNKKALDALGINHSPYTSIDSSLFENYKIPFSPFLDEGSSKTKLPKLELFKSLEAEQQQALLPWSEKGYSILKGYFSSDEVDEINAEIKKLVDAGAADWHYSRPRIMFAIRKSKKIREIIGRKKLESILSMLLGRELNLFQSINFLEGSQQKAHSDSIHMTTFPLGFLIAAWIALEDVDENNGPLFYYPGSHKLPYLLNKDFDHGGNALLIGENANNQYEKAIEKLIEKEQLQKETFYAKKGDVLIWHANLIHGGSAVNDAERSRKSMVLHYFAKDVICYHEITQRPALMPKT